VPVTVTCVAFVAVTVNVDEFPDVIVVGSADMATVGVVLVGATERGAYVPHPAHKAQIAPPVML
jgi:hypothetical protein